MAATLFPSQNTYPYETNQTVQTYNSSYETNRAVQTNSPYETNREVESTEQTDGPENVSTTLSPSQTTRTGRFNYK